MIAATKEDTLILSMMKTTATPCAALAVSMLLKTMSNAELKDCYAAKAPYNVLRHERS
nr:hypothetical protein [Aliivibrio fischeri]